MERKLTFRTKIGNWSSSNLAQWIVILGFVILTIWKDDLAFLLTSMALIVLILQQSSSNLTGVLIPLGIIVSCFIGEWIYKNGR